MDRFHSPTSPTKHPQNTPKQHQIVLGNDDGDDASPEAYMRMVWLRTRSVGCACVGSQVACIMDAGANIPADEDDPNVVSQLDFNVENICDVGCTCTKTLCYCCRCCCGCCCCCWWLSNADLDARQLRHRGMLRMYIRTLSSTSI